MATGRTNKQGGASVSLTGDAVIAEVLNSKTFYNTDPNTKLTGTMPNKVGSATVITPSTVDQTIPQGYYGGASGDGKVLGDTDLVAGNIKSGVDIFGVTGTYAPSGTIISSNRVGAPNDVNNNFMPFVSLLQAGLPISPVSFACSSDFVYMFIIDSLGNFYKSSNNGKSWTYINTYSGYKKIKCSSNGQYVYIFKKSDYPKRSSNYGVSFSDISLTAGSGDISADGSIVYIDVGTLIYKSTNYGVNFSSTGFSCYNNSSWSDGYDHICCSDNGQTVYYGAITNSYLKKSTDGLSTDGIQQVAAAIANSGFDISQDGTKWGFYYTLSSGIIIADSKLFMGIFNNGNYICSGMRSGLSTNASYWASLGTLSLTPSSRIKGLDVLIMISGSIIYIMGT